MGSDVCGTLMTMGRNKNGSLNKKNLKASNFTRVLNDYATSDEFSDNEFSGFNSLRNKVWDALTTKVNNINVKT